MSASSEGAQASAPGPRSVGPKAAFSGRIAWVFGADAPFGRALSVELAARGAEVWALGADERRLGETVGEIAYQGGRGRHLVLAPTHWAEGPTLGAPAGIAGPPDLLVAALPSAELPPSKDLFETQLARLAPALRPGGALVFALVGAPGADVAAWLRRAARAAARSERPFVLNIVVLGSADGDADGAARVTALACSADAAGLTGQLLVVASA